MLKGNKEKLRTGTANKATIGLAGPRRSWNDELPRECLHFISHVQSSRLVLVFLLSASRI